MFCQISGVRQLCSFKPKYDECEFAQHLLPNPPRFSPVSLVVSLWVQTHPAAPLRWERMMRMRRRTERWDARRGCQAPRTSSLFPPERGFTRTLLCKPFPCLLSQPETYYSTDFPHQRGERGPSLGRNGREKVTESSAWRGEPAAESGDVPSPLRGVSLLWSCVNDMVTSQL